MPYVVLARRGRPQLFASVVGQEHVTQTLQNAINSNRIAHAYLFTGPRGVGKTTVARIFAKAVNCKAKENAEPCNKCGSCLEISSGRSIDVIEIDAASNRGIDEIRELRENVKFAPVTSEYKVYIIDEAHMLTLEAFNALLKTLEEPPHHVIFILATTEPHKIPATILSRCQRFDFRMLTRIEIIDRLKELLMQDGIVVDDDALSLMAENADGALRDAESMLDQALSFSNGQLTAEEVSRFLGLGSYKLIDSLMESIINRDSSKSLDVLNSLANHGADLPQCLKKLVSYFRDLMVYKINPDLIDVSETRQQRLNDLSKNISVERIMKIARVLTQTESEIKQLGYERLNFEISLIRLSRLTDDSIPIDKILNKLQEIESKIYSGASMTLPISETRTINETNSSFMTASAEITESNDEKSEQKDIDPLISVWTDILNKIKNKCSPALNAILKEAYPISIDDSTITIDFDPKFKWHREQLEDNENRKRVESGLSDIMGKAMKIVIRSKEDPAGENNPIEEIPTTQRDMRQDAMQDEYVKMVLDIFNGRIVDIKK
ncbi:TPA: DNA polymerase III subunit gamma/tau [bacterium]|nr:DNA polymerase III subunit gamma/tau [bacterium]